MESESSYVDSPSVEVRAPHQALHSNRKPLGGGNRSIVRSKKPIGRFRTCGSSNFAIALQQDNHSISRTFEAIMSARVFNVTWMAMSHKQVLEKIIQSVLPYLATHEAWWYRDRHLHKKHGRGANPMTPYAGCRCCDAKTSLHDSGCTLCLAAWKMSMVSHIFKTEVIAYGGKLEPWWR